MKLVFLFQFPARSLPLRPSLRHVPDLSYAQCSYFKFDWHVGKWILRAWVTHENPKSKTHTHMLGKSATETEKTDEWQEKRA